ncbi:hypothetical protein GMSM_32740 [Geomonas sp. Red276]
MPNHLLIYVIVALNAACHPFLIWRLRLSKGEKWAHAAAAIAAPLLVMSVMRLLVAVGAIHARVAEQGGAERAITTLASILLIVSPLLATVAGFSRSRKSAQAIPPSSPQPTS